MRMKVFLSVLWSMVLGAGSGSALGWELEMPVLWRTDLATLLESTAVAADVNGDGLDEIVAAGREDLFVLDGMGKVLWKWHAKGRFMTYPAVYRTTEGKALVYAADSGGQLTCLDGTGHVVWQAQLKGASVWSGPAVSPLKPGGKAMVIQGDGTGLVWALDAADGKVAWQTQVEGAPVTPAVADLDGDGSKEIVVVTDAGGLFAIGSDGALRWGHDTKARKPLWGVSAPVVFEASDGKARIVAAAGDDTVGCWDGKGQLVWRHAVRGGLGSGISAGDFDGDGRCDVFVASQLGVIQRYSEEGKLLWEIDTQGRSLAPGAIVDINNDGRMEYVLASQNGRIVVLGQSGELAMEMQFPHRTIGATPALGHFVKESKTLGLALTGGESGLVVCLGTPARIGSAAEWPSYRNTTSNTGAWSRPKAVGTESMTPWNLSATEALAGEEVRFGIRLGETPREPLRAEATCIGPDGTRRSAMSRVLGKTSELRLPVDWSAAGLYRFSWQLAGADGKAVSTGVRSFSIRPMQNEMQLAVKAASELAAAAALVEKNLPHTAIALRRASESLQQDLATIGRDPKGAGKGEAAASGAEVVGLVRKARRGLRLVRIFREAEKLPAGTSLVPFEASQWDSREVDAQLPVEARRDLVVRRRLVRGEHDAVSLMLMNITDKDVVVRAPAKADAAQPVRVELLHSVPVPTSTGENSWDPLPGLDESRTLVIPSLESRELWLDVDASGAGPGTQKTAVVLQTLQGAGVLDGPSNPQSMPPVETRIELEYKILDFAMAPPGAFRLCAWANVSRGDWQDLLAHGNNVFITSLPEVRRDGQGKLAASDFAKLDAVLEKVQGHDVVMLLTGMPGLKGAVGAEGYVAELKAYLAELVRHMTAKGLDRAHYALYPIDEPGGLGWSAVNSYVAFGKAVRAADPAVEIYMDGGCELPMCEAMKPVTDIWTPSIYQLPDGSEVIRVIRGTKKTLWSYNCVFSYARPVGPNLKNVNVVAEYRNAALFALSYGATGIGFWCYNIGEDPWGRTEMEYSMVYPGQDRPVASRRWKAVRESVEDARILMALEERAGKSSNAELREKVRKLAAETVPALMKQSYEEMRLGLARYVLDATNSDGAVKAIREAMLDCAEMAGK